MKSEEGGRKREGRGQLLGRLRLKEKQLSDDLFCEDNTQANVFFLSFQLSSLMFISSRAHISRMSYIWFSHLIHHYVPQSNSPLNVFPTEC